MNEQQHPLKRQPFWDEVREVAGYEAAERHWDGKRPLPHVLHLAAATVSCGRWRLAGFVCVVRGHDWKCIGWGTPDSGYMGRTCARCGESHGGYVY